MLQLELKLVMTVCTPNMTNLKTSMFTTLHMAQTWKCRKTRVKGSSTRLQIGHWSSSAEWETTLTLKESKTNRQLISTGWKSYLNQSKIWAISWGRKRKTSRTRLNMHLSWLSTVRNADKTKFEIKITKALKEYKSKKTKIKRLNKSSSRKRTLHSTSEPIGWIRNLKNWQMIETIKTWRNRHTGLKQ